MLIMTMAGPGGKAVNYSARFTVEGGSATTTPSQTTVAGTTTTATMDKNDLGTLTPTPTPSILANLTNNALITDARDLLKDLAGFESLLETNATLNGNVTNVLRELVLEHFDCIFNGKDCPKSSKEVDSSSGAAMMLPVVGSGLASIAFAVAFLA